MIKFSAFGSHACSLALAAVFKATLVRISAVSLIVMALVIWAAEPGQASSCVEIAFAAQGGVAAPQAAAGQQKPVMHELGVFLPLVIEQAKNAGRLPKHVISVAGHFGDLANQGAIAPFSDRIFRALVKAVNAQAGLPFGARTPIETVSVGSSNSGTRTDVSMSFTSLKSVHRTQHGEIWEGQLDGDRVWVLREFSDSESWGAFTLATLEATGLSDSSLTVLHPKNSGLSPSPIERENFKRLWTRRNPNRPLAVRLEPYDTSQYIEGEADLKQVAQRYLDRVVQAQ